MILKKLFDEFNNKKIKYCVLRKYKTLPKTPNGDVDILIEKQDYQKALELIRKLDFFKYYYTQPHEFYFYFDKISGLIKLDLTKTDKIKNIKKFKNFFVPINWDKRIKKPLYQKILTNLARKIFYFNKGKLICFVGPDGAGKTTIIKQVKKELKLFPLEKKYIRFSTGTYNKIKRSLDLIKKIIKIQFWIYSGKIILSDRYMYLTFRNNPKLKKILIKSMRKPHITFYLKNSAEEIYKRKQEINPEEIDSQLKLFDDLAKTRKEFKVINTNKKIDKISLEVSAQIIELFK